MINFFKHCSYNLFVPILATLVSWGIAGYYFEVLLKPIGLLSDVLLFIVLSIFLYAFSSRLTLHSIVVSFSIALTVIGSAAKLDMLGNPVQLADLRSLEALVNILEGWRFFLLFGLGLFALLVFAYNFRLRLKLIAVSGPLVLLVFASPFVYPAVVVKIDNSFYSYVPWDQKNNFEGNGVLFYILAAESRKRINYPQKQDEASIRQILSAGPFGHGLEQPKTKRNVHLILVESLWDPMKLKNTVFSTDPIYPEFRELLSYSRSEVLVPVFGGKTANSEFEVLCGLPADSGDVEFITSVTRPLPCLPNLLRYLGYATMASHPNDKNFWGRISAYKSLGFGEYNSIDSFDMSDRNYGSFISDESLFNQNLRLVGGKKAGLFNYVVTISNHYPYGLDGKNRPAVIQVTPNKKSLRDYSNSIYYTTKETFEFIKKLRQSDPDALIVVFGDHLPALDDGRRVFSDSGLFPGSFSEYRAENYVNFSATPLLIINGRAGIVGVGKIPLFDVPGKILELLDLPPSMLPIENLVKPKDRVLRPFNGLLLMSSGEICYSDSVQASPGCDKAHAYFEDLLMVKADLLYHDQYTLNVMYPHTLMQNLSGKIAIDQNRLVGCDFSIAKFGPNVIVHGKEFNVQPSGKSAFWFSGVNTTRPLRVVVNRQSYTVVMGVDGQMSASHSDPALIQKAGTYPIRVGCNKENLVNIGTVLVQ